MEKKTTDTQGNKWLLTINNPLEKELTHEKIKKILIHNFATISYFCMADEQGLQEETPHTHIFLYFSSRVRFSKIKRHFQGAHIDKCKGNVSDNIDYVKKAGKWKEDKKKETSIEGTFEEFGERPPDSKGKRNDMSELYQMVKNGMSNTEILAENQDYILHLEKIERLRNMLLIEESKNKIGEKKEVIYIYGATGSGKSYSVLVSEGVENVYRVTNYIHPFDEYSYQKVLCLDEYRSSFLIGDILQYLDRYNMILPARYSNKYSLYEKVYIISNIPLEEQYQDIQNKQPQSWQAFLRRITEVRVHHADFSIDIYHTVEEYMSRDKLKETRDNFKQITTEEQLNLPFTNEK